MKVNLSYDGASQSDAFVNTLLSDILNDNILMSVASIKDGRSHINAAYYCFNEQLDFFFLSNPSSQHSLNIGENKSVALSVHDSHQEWDLPKKGIQLFATCEEAHGLTILEGGKLYLQRFAGFKKMITHLDDLAKNVIHSKLYVAHVSELKVFNEEVLGERVFLTLKPKRS